MELNRTRTFVLDRGAHQRRSSACCLRETRFEAPAAQLEGHRYERERETARDRDACVRAAGADA